MPGPTSPLVWLPFEPARLGDPPSGLRYQVADPTRSVPASVGEVEFYVPPYQVDRPLPRRWRRCRRSGWCRP